MPYSIEHSDGQFLIVDDSGKTIATHPTRQQAIDNLKALYANVADAKKETVTKTEGGVSYPRSAYLVVEDESAPSTWHLRVRDENGKIDPRLLGGAWAALHGGYRGNKYEGPDKGKAIEALKKLYEGEKMDTPAEKESHSIIDRVVSFLKEGRRNSSGDEGRLQQIHDLAVMNGATCPMVFKEASGKLRWVMLSSNSYQDTDKEIVAQAALEADVERADKEHNYGPLRWWHVGNPDPITRTPGDGIDIGDCDFNAMHGRMLIESGTFRDERIGEAIKEHADILAGSIGFFHPLNQPDSEGVFTSIQRFERSLLPRAKASNQLTALTVTGDQDMATMKEKYEEFKSLLGGDEDLAQSVIKQAESTEKAAHEAGLKFKEGEAEVTEKAAPVKDEPEPKAEAAAETPASEAVEMTPEKFAAYLMPQIEQKMSDMIEARMGAAKKETATKEAGLTAQIATLETKLKEVEAVARTLAGDLPRGVKDGYRASQATSTVTTKEVPNQPQADPLGDFYGWITTSLGNQPGGQPVQPPGA